MFNNKKIIYALFFIFTIACIVLPCILLHYNYKLKLGVSNNVDDTLYSQYNSVLAHNTSEKLSEYDKIKLISGAWESMLEEISPDDAIISELDAVALAKNCIASLYENGIYPYNFDSGYENWYSWDAHYYKCTETTFNTYCSYFFIISFFHYETDEIHHVFITENGTLLAVTNNIPDETEALLKEKDYKADYQEYFDNVYPYTKHNLIFDYEPKIKPLYRNIENPPKSISSSCIVVLNNDAISKKEDMEKLNLSALSQETEIYWCYQGSNENEYILCFIPYEQ